MCTTLTLTLTLTLPLPLTTDPNPNLNQDVVYVSSRDPLACSGCAYRALVYAYSDTSYSVTMSLRSAATPSLTVLQAGP